MLVPCCTETHQTNLRILCCTWRISMLEYASSLAAQDARWAGPVGSILPPQASGYQRFYNCNIPRTLSSCSVTNPGHSHHKLEYHCRSAIKQTGSGVDCATFCAAAETYEPIRAYVRLHHTPPAPKRADADDAAGISLALDLMVARHFQVRCRVCSKLWAPLALPGYVIGAPA